MKLIYAVKDTAVQAFGTPMFMRSNGEMMRSFTDEVNSTEKGSAIAAHPDDYELYRLGHFDEETGQITPNEKPELIARAKDLTIKE